MNLLDENIQDDQRALFAIKFPCKSVSATGSRYGLTAQPHRFFNTFSDPMGIGRCGKAKPKFRTKAESFHRDSAFRFFI